MTVDERRAQLLANGLRAPEVEEQIAWESVDGVWCDGSIVSDERGSRCVTRTQIDRVQRARAAEPAAPVVASVVVGGLVVGAVVLFSGLLVALERE